MRFRVLQNENLPAENADEHFIAGLNLERFAGLSRNDDLPALADLRRAEEVPPFAELHHNHSNHTSMTLRTQRTAWLDACQPAIGVIAVAPKHKRAR